MRNRRVKRLLALFGPQTIAYLMGVISLAWVLVPIQLVWLPGPSDLMLRRSLLPLGFLLITALNSMAARFGLLARRGPAIWFDTATYIILLAALRPIRSISGSQSLPVALSVLFLSLVIAKFAVLFAAIHRALLTTKRPTKRSQSLLASPGSPLSSRVLVFMFLAAFSFCFLIGLHAAAKMCTQPDEPFYLLIAQSMVHDGDLDLNNNLEAREYAPYYPGTLLPQRDVNERGQYISRHGVLFSALLIPFYASFGRVGAMALSCLAYAAFSVLLFSVCERETGSRSAAFWTWIIALVATPGLTYATQIYPESLACLLIMLLLTAALRRPTGWLAACGLAAAIILPWLKARYALVELPLLLFWLTRTARSKEKLAGTRQDLRRRRTAAAVLGGTLGSLVLALLFHKTVAFRLFGAMNLDDILHLQWSRCWYNLFALFLDFQYGLLVYSPVFLFALWGFFAILRREPYSTEMTTTKTQKRGEKIGSFRRRANLVGISALSAAVYLLALSTLGWWFGGGCPPGRYLVCLLPIFLLNVSFGLTFSRGLLGRSLLAISFIYTALMAFSMVLFPIDRYMVPGSHNLVLARLLATASPPLELVPSFIRCNVASYVSIAIFVAVMSLLFALAKRARDAKLRTVAGPCTPIIGLMARQIVG